MSPADLVVGFTVNFFDPLGIGSFARTTAICMLAASVVGARLGAGFVARGPRRLIQAGMGLA